MSKRGYIPTTTGVCASNKCFQEENNQCIFCCFRGCTCRKSSFHIDLIMKKVTGNRFSQAISKFFTMILSCSRPSAACTLPTPSMSNKFRISNTPIQRSNILLTPRRIHRLHLQSPSHSTTMPSFNQVCCRRNVNTHA